MSVSPMYSSVLLKLCFVQFRFNNYSESKVRDPIAFSQNDLNSCDFACS